MPAIGTLALENCTGIMERVGQHVHFGVAPLDHPTVEPDPSVAIVKCLRGHGAFLSFEAGRFGFWSIGVTWIGSIVATRLAKGLNYVNTTDLMGSSMSSDASRADPAAHSRRGDEPMYELIELFFFAYRDFVGDADRLLEAYGFGRAHHRVLYFVSRRPGLTIAELLEILRITKQSLNRVLGQLVRQGFIVQHPGAQDRRQRLLQLTDKGYELERQLSALQRARVAAAYRKAGAGAVEGFRKVLLNIIASLGDRHRFDRARPTGR